jgi:hypothetical protein
MEQRMIELARRAGEVLEHLRDLDRVWPRRLRARLRAPQLGSSDHLHRLGDLLGALDRPDAPAERAQSAHRVTP